MPLCYARDFFSRLTNSQNKNGEPYLTKEALDDFMERGFMGNKKIKKIKINYVSSEKTKIQSLFHTFYSKTVETEFDFSRNNDKYIHLLTDNFIGWDYENVKANFNRHSKFKW
jgi:hypothetical protein